MEPLYVITVVGIVTGLIGTLGSWWMNKVWSELDNHRKRLHALESADSAAKLGLKLLEILESKKLLEIKK